MTLLILLILFIALQFGDAITTLQALKHGMQELNPIIKVVMDKIGILTGVISYKVFAIGCGLCVAYFLTKNLATILLVIFNVIYLFVVLRNLKLIGGI